MLEDLDNLNELIEVYISIDHTQPYLFGDVVCATPEH